MTFEIASVASLIPDEQAYARAYASLPEIRRRACGGFRFAADRFRTAAAWLLLRRLLHAAGFDPDGSEVTVNAFGKPEFASAAGLHFSLSHSGERVMAAVSDRPVGCDIERIARTDEGVSRLSLAEDELAALAALPDGAERDWAFIRLWVRKESYVKALGRGMDADPRSFSVLSDRMPDGRVFRDLNPGGGYLACVCF